MYAISILLKRNGDGRWNAHFCSGCLVTWKSDFLQSFISVPRIRKEKRDTWRKLSHRKKMWRKVQELCISFTILTIIISSGKRGCKKDSKIFYQGSSNMNAFLLWKIIFFVGHFVLLLRREVWCIYIQCWPELISISSTRFHTLDKTPLMNSKATEEENQILWIGHCPHWEISLAFKFTEFFRFCFSFALRKCRISGFWRRKKGRMQKKKKWKRKYKICKLLCSGPWWWSEK